MNIGIVTTWFERGAAYVSKQYMQLLQEDNNVFIYARGGEKYAKNDPIWSLPNVHWGKIDYFQINSTPIKKSCFLKWINENKIKTIIFNEQHWWPPILWAKKLGIKVGSYIDYYTKTTVPFFGIYDFLICNTQRHYSVFNWHPQVAYIPWGTDINLFSPKAKRKQDINKLVFFNSSGYNPDRKGVYLLIKAYDKIKNKHTKLILHTQVNLKKYYNDLNQTICKLEESGHLEIIKNTVTAPGLYHLGDVYCYISKLDGIGLTLPEAISCGLQAIVPDNAPMNEFVEPDINGQLVKIKNFQMRKDGYYWSECNVEIEDIEKKLKYFINHKDEIEQLKKKSREYALIKLNWKDRAAEMNSFINSVHSLPVNEELINEIYSYSKKSKSNLGFHQKLGYIVKNIVR